MKLDMHCHVREALSRQQGKLGRIHHNPEGKKDLTGC